MSTEVPTALGRIPRNTGGTPNFSPELASPVTTATDNRPFAASVAPSALALASVVIGLFVPFIGLPLSMVSVVAAGAADIRDRRLLFPTIALVVFAIALNLLMVLMALPAGRELVEGPQ